MNALIGVNNKCMLTTLVYMVILVLGFLDYLTHSGFSFSIFYIIPMALYALYNKANIIHVVILSLVSTFLWLIADYTGHGYANVFFCIWNSFVRLCIFLMIGITLLKYKEKYKSIQALNIRLNQVNEEKNRFIGIAAHDLRSPISMIINLTGYLKSELHSQSSPELSDILKSLNDLSRHCLVMINNLLDVSKIESGEIELKYTANDYISFMNQQMEYNRLIAKDKNITIEFISDLPSARVFFDVAYITQVMNNLLSNAIKFSDRGSKIVVRVSIDPNSMILTEVIDSGRGIKTEEQKMLFNYFQKTSTRSTEGEIGTGLGLAIIKKVVLAHKGKIGLESEPGKGSRFYFLLPPEPE